MKSIWRYIPYMWLGLSIMYIEKYWNTPLNQAWSYYIIPFLIGLLISLADDVSSYLKLKKSKAKL